MQVINDVYPSDPAQIEALREKGPDGPIFMVNLLKFKDKAEYEDGRATTLTGREALPDLWSGRDGHPSEVRWTRRVRSRCDFPFARARRRAVGRDRHCGLSPTSGHGADVLLP